MVHMNSGCVVGVRIQVVHMNSGCVVGVRIQVVHMNSGCVVGVRIQVVHMNSGCVVDVSATSGTHVQWVCCRCECYKWYSCTVGVL